MTKAELREIFQRWEREEAESIEVLEAVGAYLSTKRKPPQPKPDYIMRAIDLG